MADMQNNWKVPAFLFVLLIFLASLTSASVLREGTKLTTRNATFIAGANFTFSNIKVLSSEILLDLRNLSAVSNGTNPNVTIVNFFTSNKVTLDVKAQNNSWVSLSVNASTSGKPDSVTANSSSLAENTDWFYFTGNTTVKVNLTYGNTSRRIELSYPVPSPTTTTLAGGAGGGGGGAPAPKKNVTNVTNATTATLPKITTTTEENLTESALRAIERALQAIKDAKARGAHIGKAEKILEEAGKEFSLRDYQSAKTLAEMAYEEAIKAAEKGIVGIPNLPLAGAIIGLVLLLGAILYIKRPKKEAKKETPPPKPSG